MRESIKKTKQEEREELNAHIREYLDKGGTIEQIGVKMNWTYRRWNGDVMDSKYAPDYLETKKSS